VLPYEIKRTDCRNEVSRLRRRGRSQAKANFETGPETLRAALFYLRRQRQSGRKADDGKHVGVKLKIKRGK
jgi:hypothetical protein